MALAVQIDFQVTAFSRGIGRSLSEVKFKYILRDSDQRVRFSAGVPALAFNRTSPPDFQISENFRICSSFRMFETQVLECTNSEITSNCGLVFGSLSLMQPETDSERKSCRRRLCSFQNTSAAVQPTCSCTRPRGVHPDRRHRREAARLRQRPAQPAAAAGECVWQLELIRQSCWPAVRYH